MKTKTSFVFMFSGQGSQYYHMAASLFKAVPVFHAWMDRLDALARHRFGHSIIENLYAGKKRLSDACDQLAISHPAIFMVEYALCQTLIESGIRPDYLLGASIGEVAAAAASRSIDLDTAMRIIFEQVQAIRTCCRPGAMTAVLGNVALFTQHCQLHQTCELAAVHHDSHFVIAGEREGIAQAEAFLKTKDVLYQRLPVNWAFHSAGIDPAQSAYGRYLEDIEIGDPQISLASCAKGGLRASVDWRFFWDNIRRPVQFQQAVEALEAKGPHVYLDVGPSGTLAGFLRNSLGEASPSAVEHIVSPFGRDDERFHQVCRAYAGSSKRGGKMTAFVFPGQGSQKKGMGATLFDEYPDLVGQADRILEYSIKDLCLEDGAHRLGRTEYTQPALYVVNALSYLKQIEQGDPPDYLAGHSLGEYSALYAAGAFDFATGLRIVHKRAALMGRAADGGMAAVIGLEAEKVQAILEQNQHGRIWIANYNSPTQIVVAGEKSAIETVEALFKPHNARHVIPLNVSGAFHTPLMEEARREFQAFLQTIEIQPPKIPVIANVTALAHQPDTVKEMLAQQMTHAVRWTDSVEYLLSRGQVQFMEIGPGKVLTKLIDQIQKNRAAQPGTFLKSPAAQETQWSRRNAVEASDPAPDEIPRAAGTSEFTAAAGAPRIAAQSLGDSSFRADYGLKYAYLSGGMYRGIASKALVIKLGQAGLMGFYGTGGLPLGQIEQAIVDIQKSLDNRRAYGMNLLHHPISPSREEALVDLFLRHGVHTIEASAFTQVTPALVKYRLQGLTQNGGAAPAPSNRIIAKVSRPEVAAFFMAPPPENIIQALLTEGKVTRQQAALAGALPLADDICVEADSGGHTDQGVAYALMPAMLSLRNEMMRKYNYARKIRMGAAGGIGTPEAASAAFVLGADFILTGSINQCTVEAGTSDVVKSMLQQINVQDTDYAPAGDMFEMGAKVQVLRRGVFFPARANKLYDLYRQCSSIEDIDPKTRQQLEQKYFNHSLDDIWRETQSFFRDRPEEIEKAEKNPKHKLALVFRWYFNYSTQLALDGEERHKVNFQVHSGPAMGAFNQWVKNTDLEDWRNRHVDHIAEKLMSATADLLNRRFEQLATP